MKLCCELILFDVYDVVSIVMVVVRYGNVDS